MRELFFTSFLSVFLQLNILQLFRHRTEYKLNCICCVLQFSFTWLHLQKGSFIRSLVGLVQFSCAVVVGDGCKAAGVAVNERKACRFYANKRPVISFNFVFSSPSALQATLAHLS